MTDNFVISNGQLLERIDSPIVSGWCEYTKVAIPDGTEIRVDNSVKPCAKWTGTKIPADLFKKVVGTVREFKSLELGLVLEYRVDDGAWNIEATRQYAVSCVHFSCDDTHQHEGFMSMGDIHTHPDMGAFFSGEDDFNGKRNGCGVHIVLGHHDGVIDSTAARIYLWEECFDVDIWDLVEKMDLQGDYEPDEEWLETLNAAANDTAQHEMFLPWFDPNEEEDEDDDDYYADCDADCVEQIMDEMDDDIEDARNVIDDALDEISCYIVPEKRYAEELNAKLRNAIISLEDAYSKSVDPAYWTEVSSKALDDVLLLLKTYNVSDTDGCIVLECLHEASAATMRIVSWRRLQNRSET